MIDAEGIFIDSNLFFYPNSYIIYKFTIQLSHMYETRNYITTKHTIIQEYSIFYHFQKVF